MPPPLPIGSPPPPQPAAARAAAETGEAQAATAHGALAPSVLDVGTASASELHVGMFPSRKAACRTQNPCVRCVLQGSLRAMTEPWEMTATDALAAMRARDLSPVELLESVERRADEVEPVVNALCERRPEEAREAAEASARRYASGERIRPLEGLPVALKEEVPVKGWRMRYGSLAIDEIATETAPIAERILRAGAVVHARTTTPEFSCTGYTHSKLWGVTRNPWNPTVAVGRLERRRRCVARERHVAARQRLRHRRVDPHPGVDQRGRRVQAAARPGSDRPAVQPRPLLPRRPARSHGRRLRPVRERGGRPSPSRCDVAAAEATDPGGPEGHRGVAHRALGRSRGVAGRPRGGGEHEGRRRCPRGRRCDRRRGRGPVGSAAHRGDRTPPLRGDLRSRDRRGRRRVRRSAQRLRARLGRGGADVPERAAFLPHRPRGGTGDVGTDRESSSVGTGRSSVRRGRSPASPRATASSGRSSTTAVRTTGSSSAT